MRDVAKRARWQGQAPRGSLLHPVWEPVTSGDPSDEAFVARCLLGAGWVGATRRLSMIDLRVWAAVCAQLREQVPSAPAEDPTLDRRSTRTVHTTGYQLVDAVFGTDGGDKYRRLHRSLVRLRGATVVVHIVESDPELAARHVTSGYVGLLDGVWLATTELEFRTPQQWGALHGATSLRAEVGHWTAQQILAGRTTWLDLDLLRALGSGLAARVWAALEAWGSWPARTMDEREECAIGLGEPARQSLGVAHYERLRDARAALNRAGQRIAAADPAYELVRCEKRAGWCLVVRRLSGARARAQARSGAAWRSPGSAASERQRPERAAVRAAAAESLDSVRSKPV
jgi:hypothetical protein